ncbi:MAG: DUF1611 domain-containing protein, partial [Planctomycetota bacterium]|nr:DUF1611 domain-containing protein [Planctomycetota bacterium]
MASLGEKVPRMVAARYSFQHRMIHTIATPYLLFLGDTPLGAFAKTATGVAHWRPEACVGVWRTGGEESIGDLPLVGPVEAVQAGARTLVVGSAPVGGDLPAHWVADLEMAVAAGLDLANGLHTRLGEIDALAKAAAQHDCRIHDVRYPGGQSFRVGSGQPRTGHRLLTVGTDCAVGKMFTALSIERELQSRGRRATFRATGQTGILIAGCGVAVDAVVADFVSGAVEELAPANVAEHWDLIEGQGSLFHPGYAGVSLGLLHGAQAEALVLCHEPGRANPIDAPAVMLPA